MNYAIVKPSKIMKKRQKTYNKTHAKEDIFSLLLLTDITLFAKGQNVSCCMSAGRVATVRTLAYLPLLTWTVKKLSQITLGLGSRFGVSPDTPKLFTMQGNVVPHQCSIAKWGKNGGALLFI